MGGIFGKERSSLTESLLLPLSVITQAFHQVLISIYFPWVMKESRDPNTRESFSLVSLAFFLPGIEGPGLGGVIPPKLRYLKLKRTA